MSASSPSSLRSSHSSAPSSAHGRGARVLSSNGSYYYHNHPHSQGHSTRSDVVGNAEPYSQGYSRGSSTGYRGGRYHWNYQGYHHQNSFRGGSYYGGYGNSYHSYRNQDFHQYKKHYSHSYPHHEQHRHVPIPQRQQYPQHQQSLQHQPIQQEQKQEQELQQQQQHLEPNSQSELQKQQPHVEPKSQPELQPETQSQQEQIATSQSSEHSRYNPPHQNLRYNHNSSSPLYQAQAKSSQTQGTKLKITGNPILYLTDPEILSSDPNKLEEIHKVFQESDLLDRRLGQQKLAMWKTELELGLLNTQSGKDALNVQLNQEKLDTLLMES